MSRRTQRKAWPRRASPGGRSHRLLSVVFASGLAVLAGSGLAVAAARSAGALTVPAVGNAVSLEPTTATVVAAGGSHTCAVTSAGGAKCWGSNVQGQVGDGTRDERSTPVPVSGLASGVMVIAAGGIHTCALTSAGGVKCWGANGQGQVGDGTTTPRWTPVDVSGLTSGVAAITTGHDHTCALTNAGGVKCWGDNTRGQLGDGTTFPLRTTPVDVSGLTSGVVAIAAGRWHTCALTNAGAAKCWGYNAQGQLGDGQTCGTDSCLTPVSVVGLASGVARIDAGDYHTCASTSGGAVKCWGYNGDGELGDGTRDGSSTPVNVFGLTNSVTGISAGGAHTCAVASGGVAKCWGSNAQAQLGDGTFGDSLVPGNVSGLDSGTIAVSAGQYHTCAVSSTGSVSCWGSNGESRLGDGAACSSYATCFSATPIDVMGFEAPKKLVVHKAGSGEGTVTSSPAGINCGATCSHPFSYGASVILVATGTSGSTFIGWSGDCSGAGSSCQLTMSAGHSATATFASASPSPPPPPPPTAKVYAPDCKGRRHLRPAKIVIACGDGTVSLHRLRWSRWSRRAASGVGVYRWKDCKPSCSRGRLHSRAGAHVNLYRVRWCRSQRFWQFTRVRVIPPRSLQRPRPITRRLSCK
jgi:alpha-tubulin suppressor-like RCC1 family protein